MSPHRIIDVNRSLTLPMRGFGLSISNDQPRIGSRALLTPLARCLSKPFIPRPLRPCPRQPGSTWMPWSPLLARLIQQSPCRTSWIRFRPSPTHRSFICSSKIPSSLSLKSALETTSKLIRLRQVELPSSLFHTTPPRLVHLYRERVASKPPREVRRHHALSARLSWHVFVGNACMS